MPAAQHNETTWSRCCQWWGPCISEFQIRKTPRKCSDLRLLKQHLFLFPFLVKIKATLWITSHANSESDWKYQLQQRRKTIVLKVEIDQDMTW